MRILLVNTRFFRGGGDSTYVFNLADLLRSQGHEVAFFAMHDARNLPDPNSDLFVSPIDFRSLNRAKSLRTGLQVLGRAIYSTEARKKFDLLLDRFQPDIVHLQNYLAHITASIIFAARARGLPVVSTLHDFRLLCPNTTYIVDATGEICEACGAGAYYRALLKSCKKGSRLASGMAALEAYMLRLMGVRQCVDAFLAPSIFLRDKLLAQGFPPHKVHHVPLFLPPEQFVNGSENDGYLLFLGRLEPIKGIRSLLLACGAAPQISLLLAGECEGAFAGELAGLLPANAHYLGLQQGQALRRLLARALAVVVPSLFYENQPFSILEAFAAGKPVITSCLGGMAELVPHGERGLLVGPGHVDGLAEAMSWIVAHPVEASRIGGAAQEYARQAHGAAEHYARLTRVYEKVLAR